MGIQPVEAISRKGAKGSKVRKEAKQLKFLCNCLADSGDGVFSVNRIGRAAPHLGMSDRDV